LNLQSQRRLAAELLKVGVNRVWIDPRRSDDVEVAITRAEIRKLIHEDVISKSPVKSVSRARARALHEKKKKGLKRGPGTKKGSSGAKITKKEAWMLKIRALRKTLRGWKADRAISENAYRRLYAVAGSGAFSSVGDLERYVKNQGMWRKR
jgi:large subunit ribosomal protein L19e